MSENIILELGDIISYNKEMTGIVSGKNNINKLEMYYYVSWPDNHFSTEYKVNAGNISIVTSLFRESFKEE